MCLTIVTDKAFEELQHNSKYILGWKSFSAVVDTIYSDYRGMKYSFKKVINEPIYLAKPNNTLQPVYYRDKYFSQECKLILGYHCSIKQNYVRIPVLIPRDKLQMIGNCDIVVETFGITTSENITKLFPSVPINVCLGMRIDNHYKIARRQK